MFAKKVFLKILQNLQENTCTGVLFLIKLQDENCFKIHKKTRMLEPRF